MSELDKIKKRADDLIQRVKEDAKKIKTKAEVVQEIYQLISNRKPIPSSLVETYNNFFKEESSYSDRAEEIKQDFRNRQMEKDKQSESLD